MYCIYHTRKRKERKNEKENNTIPNVKNILLKRWVVERTNSWHNRFRKLFTRYEKKVRELSWFGAAIM